MLGWGTVWKATDMDSEEDDDHTGGQGPEQVDREHFRGDVGWLKRREGKQNKREEDFRLNWKYDCELQQEKDLGDIKPALAFVFRMGEEDDGPEDTNRPMKPCWDDVDQIPLEAWQLCHMMWKWDFHITHRFSAAGHLLYILIGLPYKKLVEEAGKMKIKMRLARTKGMHPFNQHLVERYAVGSHTTKSPFTSAHRQGLTLRRLKKRARINPADMAKERSNKSQELHAVRQKFTKRLDIRGRALQHLFIHFGVFRPHSAEIFGELVKRVSLVVISDPWMLIAPAEHLDEDQRRSEAEESVSYEEVGECLDVLENWNLQMPGKYESFSGSYDDFFPTHDKDILANLQERWGSFGHVKWGHVTEKPTEYVGAHSMHHPHNEEARQFAPLWQPIDEVRDYFGEHVGMYFAWMELYTQALVWPSVLGVVGCVMQFTGDGEVDDNPFTIP